MAIKTDTFSSAGGASAVDSVNGQTGVVVVSGNDIVADHTASNYTATNNNIDGHLSGIDTKLGTLVSGLTYKGTFFLNNPPANFNNAEQGDFYLVNGSGSYYGKIWATGDHLVVNADMGGTVTNSKIDKVDNTDQVTSVNAQTGAVSLSGNDLAADHTASNYTPANSNIDGHFSGVDTKLGTLLSDITSESLNDLSDVSYTAGAGIDNYVLTYDNSTTSWGAEVVPSAPVSSVNTLTGAVVVSGNDIVADHTASNYTAGNANIDGHLSGIDTKFGTLGTASTKDVGTGANNVVQLDASSRLPAVDGSQLTNLPSAPVDSVNGDTGAVIVTLDSATDEGATTTNAITVGGVTTSGNILADADATRTIGAEATRFVTYHGDMNGAIRFKAKNNQGSAITKGQVVYISGVSGTVPEVKLARANSASTMPAFGLALANANDQAEVQIITFGNLTDYNTTTYSLSANDTVFVSATTAGALTNSAPTGESSLIQNIGRVVRADASAGIIKVGGAGRSNATPNLDEDKIFLGNASNQSASTALSAIGLSKFNNDSSFLTNINNESLNDLSDVSYTAGAGIDNYVLTYDHSSTSWGAEVVPSAPVTSVNTLTGAVVVSGNDIVADHTASNYTATNNNIDGHLSGIDTKLGTLVSGLTYKGTFFLNNPPANFNNAEQGDFYLVNGSGSYYGKIWATGDHLVVNADMGGTVANSKIDKVDNTDQVTSVNAQTGAVSLSGNDLAADHSASNYTASNSTIEGHLSGIDTKFGTLGTASTSASTDFLSATGADSLGGNLDVNGHDIISTSNGDIEVAPDGNGSFIVKGNATSGSGRIVLNCEQNSHGITLKGPPHSAAASYTLTFPNDDGDADQVLKTDGNGNLDWVDQSGGGGSAPTVTSASTTTTYPSSGDLASSGLEQIYLLTPTNDTVVNLAPSATCGSGFKYQIKNLGAYTLTITPDSAASEYIDFSSQTTFDIGQYESVTLVSDGSNWFII